VKKGGLFFSKLDTELVVHGLDSPRVDFSPWQGDSINLRDDGSFTIRVNQPEGRQVVAFTAMSSPAAANAG